MNIALLTTDGRTMRKDHSTPAPYFGTKPEALIRGFVLTSEKITRLVLAET